MKAAYIHVSSAEQNKARQVEALEKYGIEKWFVEKIVTVPHLPEN